MNRNVWKAFNTLRGEYKINMDNLAENNEVRLMGKVESETCFSHEIYGEKFYTFVLCVKRLSEQNDYINITYSERLTNRTYKVGEEIMVIGQFRSYNNYSSVGNRLVLTVFAKEILKENITCKNPNEIKLTGYVCKEPIYRKTPFGREITDILLAVNRAYKKSDYIPCIAWGRNAKYASEFSVGDNISISGRIQSREYQKKISEDEQVLKTAFEVSVSKIELLDNLREGTFHDDE